MESEVRPKSEASRGLPRRLRARAIACACTLPLAACAAMSRGGPGELVPDGARIVDLTHTFGEDTIYWPTDTRGFELEESAHGFTEKGYFYAANRFSTAEHGGTHLDAPIHFHAGGETVDQIPLEHLIGPAAVVDVSARCAEDRDYLVTVDDLRSWERANGRDLHGRIVLLHTGFGARWPEREAYLGTDATGPGAVAELHFPGLDPDAARWLVEERSILAIGLDTPSIDHGPSSDFQAHRILFERNVPAFENVARLDELPASGAIVIALPMKIGGGSGAPLRIVALVPEARP